MSIAIEELPKVIILEPGRGVRMEVKMSTPSCEIELGLDKEKPGRSVVLMIGQHDGEVLQRVRVSGKAKVLFDPEEPGEYDFLLTNPTNEVVVVHWDVRAISQPKAPSPPAQRRRRPEYDPAFR